MAIFVRSKRVSAPLDDAARARLRGELTPVSSTSTISSSGSDHDNTPCLSTLIHDFFEPTTTTISDHNENPSSSSTNRAPHIPPDAVLCMLNCQPQNSFHAGLASTVSTLVASFGPNSRQVMTALRAAGYNAGLCKSSWQASGNLTAGTHEYIDVVGLNFRYLVDVNFAAEFVIARPSKEYMEMVAVLPRVAVVVAEEMGTAVKAVAEAAERSMRKQGLSVPPWRKGRYMVAKWLGPYRRTVNALPAAMMAGAGDVRCRFVGFHAEMGPLAARTR